MTSTNSPPKIPMPTVCVVDLGISVTTPIVPSARKALTTLSVPVQAVTLRTLSGEGAWQAALNDNTDTAKALDQYYTNEEVARYLFQVFCRYFNPSLFHMIEPSAGAGSFSKLLNFGSIAVDIDPRCLGIIMADFLKFFVAGYLPCAVIGNPPFGFMSTAAVDFFNHAARYSTVIAMIVPRTFRKATILHRLNRGCRLLHDEDLPPDAFLFEGKPYDVPAAFQIWQREPILRELPPIETRHPDFVFTSRQLGDFAIQRVGHSAGRVYDDTGCSHKNTYFIRATARSQVARLRSIMEKLDFAEPAASSAGYPSLAKSEIVALYREHTEGVPPHWRLAPRMPSSFNRGDY